LPAHETKWHEMTEQEKLSTKLQRVLNYLYFYKA